VDREAVSMARYRAEFGRPSGALFADAARRAKRKRWTECRLQHDRGSLLDAQTRAPNTGREA
jgi:hypothetical protein